MNEGQWVTSLKPRIEDALTRSDPQLHAYVGRRLAYSMEIQSYDQDEEPQRSVMSYQTDLLVGEDLGGGVWKPRVVVEAKLGSVTTHDAITYSQKAIDHKNVHPYLRYGFIIGANKGVSLPGRLFRHGGDFDFMLSCKGENLSELEYSTLIEMLLAEVEASRALERIVFNTRAKDRHRYFCLHRRLILK